ncbi:MAG: spondin domain-containing protein [Granulosicoccus sp.]|nr:spondin domain-containing protein [Granulosicoccus sp.]
MKKNTLLLLSGVALLTAQPQAWATDYEITVTNLTRGIHFTPVLLAAHADSAQIFSAGTAASPELQAVAEGGDISSLQALLEGLGANVAAGAGLIAPGSSESFSLSNTASPDNTRLSAVSMLLPTNDGFAGLNSAMLPTGAVGTSMTFNVLGYDAGTEANDELVGSGAPGEAGFPAPPPVVATGTGTGGTGVASESEGFVHVHRNVLGDNDSAAGVSDINSTVHRWLNPVARITVTISGN